MRSTAIAALTGCLAVNLVAQDLTIDRVDNKSYPQTKIYATVSDARGGPICRLRRDDFRLWESQENQQLRVLTGQSTETSIGILLDASQGMPSVFDRVKAATQGFLREVDGNDRAMTYSFDSSLHPLQTMLDVAVGQNQQALIESLQSYRQHDGKAELYGAVGELIQREFVAKKEDARRRALIVLTGSRSEDSLATAILMARENRVAVYIVALGDSDSGSLDSLALETGGRFYRVPEQPTTETLTAVYDDIRSRLECQYTLMYEATNACLDGTTGPIHLEIPSLNLESHGEVERPLDFTRLDLSLGFADEHLEIDPTQPRECDTVELRSRIKATSCSDELVLENIIVRAYDTSLGERVEVARSGPIRVRSNGPPTSAIIDWDTRNLSGERDLELVIDPVDGMHEILGKNTVRTARVQVQELIHDLKIASIAVSPQPATPCEVVELAVTIQDGSRCLGMVLHNIEVEARDGQRSLGKAITTLEVGFPQPIFFEWNPAGFIGRRPLSVILDPDHSFRSESTRSNNVKEALVDVEPVEPDLRVMAVTVEPEHPIVGDEVTFRVEVGGHATCLDGASNQRAHVRLDDYQTGQILARSELFAVGAGHSVVVPVVWRPGFSDQGEKTVKLFVDPVGVKTDSIPPCDENDGSIRTLRIRPMSHDLRSNR